MPCDFPLRAYLTGAVTPAGKSVYSFNAMDSVRSNGGIEIPCNNCVGCKLERARQWSIRMMHEVKCHSENCFLTLTYDDQHVPQDYSLKIRDMQLFWKKLRQKLGDRVIRYFCCGEYGDLNGRPHYHAIVFNYDAADKKPHSRSESGELIYTSEVLSQVWGNGHIVTQDVTRKSCAYVARYCLKKVKTGDTFGADRYYRVSPMDGQAYSVSPEFATMSRRTGIGSGYVDRFKSDFYPSGFLVVDGVRQAPPQFYLSRLSEAERHRLKLNRPRKPVSEKTMERRLARAAVRDARIEKLKRTL